MHTFFLNVLIGEGKFGMGIKDLLRQTIAIAIAYTWRLNFTYFGAIDINNKMDEMKTPHLFRRHGIFCILSGFI